MSERTQGHRGRLPTTPGGSGIVRGDRDAWAEWNARLKTLGDRLVTDALTFADYPGTKRGWEAIVAQDDKLRRAMRNKRDPIQRADEPSRSRIPEGFRNRLADVPGDTDAHSRIVNWLGEWGSGDDVRGLLIVGPIGAGKTTLAAALAVECGEPVHCGFATARGFVAEEVTHHRDRPGGPSPRDRLCDRSVLVLDDLGRESATWQQGVDTLEGLLLRRYDVEKARRDREGRRFRTVITTNLTAHDRAQRYSGQVVSRLAEMCEVVPMAVEDRRQERAA